MCLQFTEMLQKSQSQYLTLTYLDDWWSLTKRSRIDHLVNNWFIEVQFKIWICRTKCRHFKTVRCSTQGVISLYPNESQSLNHTRIFLRCQWWTKIWFRHSQNEQKERIRSRCGSCQQLRMKLIKLRKYESWRKASTRLLTIAKILIKTCRFLAIKVVPRSCIHQSSKRRRLTTNAFIVLLIYWEGHQSLENIFLKEVGVRRWALFNKFSLDLNTEVWWALTS